MNNDEELLELAAKAAKYDVDFSRGECHGGYPKGVDCDGGYETIWNPLTDDGDAFRLAIKLRMRFECCNSGIVYVWRGLELVWNEFALHENSDTERYAATRRAIVRAAAEIGRKMK